MPASPALQHQFLWRKAHGSLARGCYRSSPWATATDAPCPRLHCSEGTTVVSPAPWTAAPSPSPRVTVTPVQRMSILPRKPIDCRKWLHCPSSSEVKHWALTTPGHVFLLLLFTHLPHWTGDKGMKGRTFGIWEGWSVWLWVFPLPRFAKNRDGRANPSESRSTPGSVPCLRLATPQALVSGCFPTRAVPHSSLSLSPFLPPSQQQTHPGN